jgi:hypothetical protein
MRASGSSLERLRKQGHAEAKAELLPAAVAALAEAECTRVQVEPPSPVALCCCEQCGVAHLPDGRPPGADDGRAGGLGLAAALPTDQG